MSHLNTEEFDVVVVGGGPAGSTVASFVAKKGHRVLLLEKETFPRHQIGESLLPPTVHGICNMLGVSEEVLAAGFVTKLGSTNRWGANPDPWTFVFADNPAVPKEKAFAYQVERMKFDNILLQNARKLGVEVRENCSVGEVIEDGDRIAGVRYTDGSGTERAATAKFVVDASGNKSRIYRNVVDSRWYSDFFKNIALFGYFEDGKRLPAPNSGNTLSVAFESGWFWYIPLSDKMTSVGVVVKADMVNKIQGNKEEAMNKLIAECPMISDYLSNARRITEGPYGELRIRKDYSYSSSKFWRPGMVLVGDAACFVDPVLSSGVHLATYSGLLAARSINSVLADEIEEKVVFEEFEARYRREYGNVYEFLVSFYDTHVDENSYFWSAKKVTNHPSSELAAFVGLVGGTSSGDKALLGSGKPAGGILDKQITMREMMADSFSMSKKSWLPEDIGQRVSQRVGDLVPSEDGLQWIYPERTGQAS